MIINYKKLNGILIITLLSLVAFVLAFIRYPCLWPGFPHIEFFWKVYLDHFIAGFVLPIWAFTLYLGFFALINKPLSLNTQKKVAIFAIISALSIAVIWDLVMPIVYLIVNKVNFSVSIYVLNWFYNSPHWEGLQFFSDMAGTLFSIYVLKLIREDLK